MSGSTKIDGNKNATGLTNPPSAGTQTFMGLELALDLENLESDIAILGVPHGASYDESGVSNDQSNGPAAIRQASKQISGGPERWDFDLGGTLLDGKPIRLADCAMWRET